MILIAPSILSADFSAIGKAVKLAEEAKADLIHVDIMDGHFVPNLTFGPQLVTALKKVTSLPLDVHLMVKNPGALIPRFHEAGADWISIHQEATVHLNYDINLIKKLGGKAGVALNPATPIHQLTDILPDVDFILLMTVNPGWGGQSFIEPMHSKITQLKNWIKEHKFDIPIQVDGGIKLDNFEQLLRDGADIIVSGSGIFSAGDPREAIREMKAIIKKVESP